MIEIATAMSIATTAFRGVKKMVEAGKEAEDMYGYFMKFFEATESVSEADVLNQNAPKMSKFFAGKSVEAQALEIAMARSRMEKMEKDENYFSRTYHSLSYRSPLDCVPHFSNH